MIERLNEFIVSLRISVREFERSIAASEGTIRLAIKKNSDIQAKWLVAIAKNYPQLNIEWLLLGEGPMLKGAEAVTEAAPPSPPVQAEGNPMAEALLAQLAEKDRQIAQLLAIISNK